MAKIPKKMKRSVRFMALMTLERVNKGGAYSNLLLNEMINQGDLNQKDIGLFTELVYGTISRHRLIAFYVAPLIANAKKVDDWVKTLLYLSVYQLEFLDKVPDHAILNEAVEIAKIKGNPGAGKFVNGVLRNYLRQGKPDLETITDEVERLAVKLSLPNWLTQRLIDQIGYEETEKLGLSLYQPSHVSGRIDTRKLSREQALDQLKEEGLDVKASPISPYGVIAEKGRLASTTLFHDGLMTIQDESSMLVAPAMQIEPEHHVLDACAAPGGKTTHIATFLDPTCGGEVVALDVHDHKVKLVEENARRLGVANAVFAQKMDAREVKEQFEAEQFDRILVDAPCSGFGLLRRKPDIRYKNNEKELANLPAIQLAILESVATALKPSGILTYSTCTILKEENQEVVSAFLQRHPDFEKIDVLVDPVLQSSIKDKMLTLYPHQSYTDGFFICCLRKK
ncbi:MULTISPECIES: 16S rRNA (cytosine(967)-C(5))-methyltransferase RsmB [Enterococcus]|uniref:16S rRNA (cytosine(967)-C(5))-methyltransferase RsmB n=1 Tax=Enterococcus TaxID=1350 RepID=UPI00031F37BA|nr:16S rRNA (cytosine(967)-C(5))-methyltransferase RsmB [Enterococcus mundtii]MBO1086286.1 16S rRNA (cytosine(967)-C(5))-methyltransferase RsmB [Enterococcus mundtii]MDB7102013.1 16S rRNA (cytosine(967)-C(5))-methyltransferase RsmB [Enterococcus mundtii]MDV7744291.1 16S rRNA (cytosine(967)-C(5))-methyltransferase RsmB [Enterococcus mundtii]